MFVMFLVLQMKIWDNEFGLPNLITLSGDNAASEMIKKQLVDQNITITNKIQNISDTEVERIAREDLGMIGSGEVYMQFK